MKRFLYLVMALVMVFSAAGSALAEEAPAYTAEEVWCVNENAAIFNGEENADIFGTMYYPLDFDESRTWPVVVVSHGFGNSSALMNFPTFPWVRELTGLGCVVYAFDFCGGAPAGGMMATKSDGDFGSMSVMTEADDLKAVVRFVQELPWVDGSQIYLMGQSQGGLVSAIVASQLETEGQQVAGLVLLWPAFSMISGVQSAFPTAEDLPAEPRDWAGQQGVGPRYFSDVYDKTLEELIGAYSGRVLDIHGMADTSVPYTISVEAMDKFYADNPDASLVLVAGAGHTFVGRGGSDEAVSIAVTNVNRALSSWIAGGAAE